MRTLRKIKNIRIVELDSGDIELRGAADICFAYIDTDGMFRVCKQWCDAAEVETKITKKRFSEERSAL